MLNSQRVIRFMDDSGLSKQVLYRTVQHVICHIVPPEEIYRALVQVKLLVQ